MFGFNVQRIELDDLDDSGRLGILPRGQQALHDHPADRAADGPLGE